MNDQTLSLHSCLTLMDILCERFATYFKPLPPESISIIRHKVSCTLFEAVADEFGIDHESFFQCMKYQLEIEDELNPD